MPKVRTVCSNVYVRIHIKILNFRIKMYQKKRTFQKLIGKGISSFTKFSD